VQAVRQDEVSVMRLATVLFLRLLFIVVACGVVGVAFHYALPEPLSGYVTTVICFGIGWFADEVVPYRRR
jgi:hypothetical protein